MRFPLLARLAVVGAVALALLVPLSMIRGKVDERSGHAAAVRKSFAEETSGPQTIAGPVLALACEETYVEERTVHQRNGKPLTVREKRQRPCATALFLPERLSVRAQAPVETRQRGIFPVRFYKAKLELAAEFDLPKPPEAGGEVVRVWKEAALVVGVSDVRGIRGVSAQTAFAPGTFDTRIRSGLHAPLGSYARLKAAELSFRIGIDLVGTGRLDIAPLGDRNEVGLESSWPHPSFVGAYPPEERRVRDDGFSASWRVNDFATGGAAFWLEAIAADKLFSNARLLGVALVDPVNPYSMAYRATEYGFLFVLLTFALFGLAELVWGVRLHPVQYALTGLALAVFFLLLLAFSEHIRFGLAYTAAAAACVALLGFYLRHPLGGRARAAAFVGLFLALYCALYVLLASEDHALLLGALLVFGVLAAIMALTRKLDWTGLSRRLAPPA